MDNFADIKYVCIDDFALKKRQRYGTVMVNLETHKIVDMIESREMSDVSHWLSNYPNICVVSRDGSLTYASAINESHPEAMQVSDRFHIIKNLNERATLTLQKLFQGRIQIPMTSGTYSIKYEVFIGSTIDRIKIVKKLSSEGRTQSEIHQITGLRHKVIKQYININESDYPEEKQTVREREHIEAVRTLTERSNRVKLLYNEGLSIYEINRVTGFTYNTIKNYLSPDFSPVRGQYGVQREGKLEPYRDDVIKWKIEGLSYRDIHNRIRENGYTGTQDAIRGFISKERRLLRDFNTKAGGEAVEYIDRKWIIRLLYKPADDLKGISAAQIEAIYEKYPLAKSIIEMVSEFRNIFKEKDPSALLSWIDQATALKLPEFDAFINGLNQDFDAVSNAVSTDFSNGLAEGIINKIKVIKRIMYGRCKFNLLRNKCLLLSRL